MSINENIRKALSTAKGPMTTDQIQEIVGEAEYLNVIQYYLISNELNRMFHEGDVCSRKCPDSPSFQEWWLPEREEQLIFLPYLKKP